MHAAASESLETEIETARLLLRAPRLSDAGAMARLANDPAVSLMTARMPHPYGVEDAKAFIQRQQAEAASGVSAGFVIERLGDRSLLGGIGFMRGKNGLVEIGYWLGRPHWGAGYATEAARAVVDHIFEATGAEGITASVRVINDASRRVIEKCGLRYVESGLDPAPARGGALPVDRFRLTRRDWTSFKAWRPATSRARATAALEPALST
jgi:RimJ/RimL family protein N-acetyltransferase